MVTPQLSFGGAEVHVINLANGLVKGGHRVTILSSGGNLEASLNQDIQVKHGPVNKKSLISIFKCAMLIKRIIIDKEIDLVHTHGVTPSISARIATIMGKVPIINTAHGWETDEYKRVAKFLKWTVNQVIAVSKSLADSLIQEGLPANLVEVVYNGINLNNKNRSVFKNAMEKSKTKEKINWSANTLIITTVARLEPPKGLFVLMDAIKQLVQLDPKVKFVLVGDGTLRSLLEKKAHELDLDNKIVFLGWQEDVAGILAVSDIFCLPSLREGLPLSVAEAMGASLPVVATEVNGLPEMVVDEVTGFLVPPNNPEALAAKMLVLLSNPAMRQRMGMMGRERAEQLFDSNNMVKNTEEVYFKVIK